MTITLSRLEPSWMKFTQEAGPMGSPVRRTREVATRAEANGVRFLCPGCYAKNNGPEGTHVVQVWFAGVPLDVSPGPGRWEVTGDTLDTLTLSPSVWLMKSCGWHGWVRGGQASNA